MHFKRFIDIKASNNNILIIFNNNKILYEPNLKTFLLEENLLNIQIKDHLYIGIGNNGKDIYAVDISNNSNDVNIGYESIVEYDLRHLLAISNPKDIVLMGRANQLLHWIKSNKYSGYSGKQVCAYFDDIEVNDIEKIDIISKIKACDWTFIMLA